MSEDMWLLLAAIIVAPVTLVCMFLYLAPQAREWREQ